MNAGAGLACTIRSAQTLGGKMLTKEQGEYLDDSCCFPYYIPNVGLETHPVVHVIDANDFGSLSLEVGWRYSVSIKVLYDMGMEEAPTRIHDFVVCRKHYNMCFEELVKNTNEEIRIQDYLGRVGALL